MPEKQIDLMVKAGALTLKEAAVAKRNLAEGGKAKLVAAENQG
jgi:hypothetical protein